MKIDKEALHASSMGIEIALSTGLGMFFGWWLDKKFDTAPWLFIVFFMAGIGSAIKALMRMIKIVEAQDTTEEEIISETLIPNKEDFKEKDNTPD
jgi:ATP synthase protein I